MYSKWFLLCSTPTWWKCGIVTSGHRCFVSVIPDCRFKPNIRNKIGLKLTDETQINSDGMINLSVKRVDGIDLSSHNFHVAKVKVLSRYGLTEEAGCCYSCE